MVEQEKRTGKAPCRAETATPAATRSHYTKTRKQASESVDKVGKAQADYKCFSSNMKASVCSAFLLGEDVANKQRAGLVIPPRPCCFRPMSIPQWFGKLFGLVHVSH